MRCFSFLCLLKVTCRELAFPPYAVAPLLSVAFFEDPSTDSAPFPSSPRLFFSRTQPVRSRSGCFGVTNNIRLMSRSKLPHRRPCPPLHAPPASLSTPSHPTPNPAMSTPSASPISPSSAFGLSRALRAGFHHVSFALSDIRGSSCLDPWRF